MAESIGIRRLVRGRRGWSPSTRTHAPYPAFGDACLNGQVDAFLTTGTLPPADVAC
ncbi:hypothetical protein [Microbispora sp. KK1-11]|uniref:hypothetical protein n=1 Tax=Microbispora sp. KK1-11 TaxID=2053005 RepID=UPI00163B8367|nr:hypothetical protein [Microbispora sp. KK1-11]